VSAVTGACLGIRRQVFDELGGFDAALAVSYNDIDLCLRAREAGYEVVCEPRATLVHKECASRRGGDSLEETRLFFRRWGSVLALPDPYYSPNLRLDSEDPKLNFDLDVHEGALTAR
jgi:GT2 family glycosyltransferase